MRTTLTTLCFTASILLALASSAVAQQSSRRTTSSNERVARASWQPVRTAPAASQDPISDDEVVQRASHGASEQIKVANRARRSTSPQRSGQVRQVGHQVGVLPAPPSNGPVSIVQSAPTPIPHGSVTLDGQVVSDSVVYESVGAPIYDGSVMSYGGVACDAMPGAGCGCDSPVCTGGCDAMGCDSMGCSGGTCGGKDCSMCGELASGPAWRPAVTIRLPQDGWFSYEYLSWWQDGMALPPLITTSPQGTQRAQAGVLGQTGTTTLFGDGDVLDDSIDGVRLNFGFWFDRCHTMGLGADYFNIGSETETFTATSTGNPILARPFFNTLTGLNDAELVAFTGAVDGTVTARATSELHGGGFYFRRLRCCDEGCTGGWICGCSSAFCSRTEARVGYRYLQLDESLTITEDLTSTDTANPGTFDIMDRFDTRNQFNGFDLGWSYRRVRDYWTCDVLLKLAIGNTHQIVTIDGTTTTNDPTDPPTVTRTGGLLAQVSNIGEYENDEFAVVPEFNLNIGYQMTDHFRLMAGYTAIYWSNVVRPGDQISLDLNTDQLPPEAEPVTGIRRPTFAFRTSDYWIQGINFGGEYRW